MNPHDALAAEDEAEEAAEHVQDALTARAAEPHPPAVRGPMFSGEQQPSTRRYLEAGESETEETP